MKKPKRIRRAKRTQAEPPKLIDPPPLPFGPSGLCECFVSNDTMVPRFFDGERIFIEKRRPPRDGEDVLVLLRSSIAAGCGTILRRLVERTPEGLMVKTFNPSHTSLIEARYVVDVYRIMTAEDVFDFLGGR